jgi:hypothetical protein
MSFEMLVPAKQVSPLVILHGTPRCDLHKTFKLPRVYDCITKLWPQEAEVIQNNENANVPNTGKGQDRHKKCKSLELASDRSYNC